MQRIDARGGPAGRPTPAEIFLAFLRLGLVAFGGPAMVAYIRDLAVTRRRWVAPAVFEEGIALCQSIPGATAMQAAAYAGLRAGGARGALAAYAGFGLPAVCLMTGLSELYLRTREITAAAALFGGLKVVVLALVANAAVDFGRRFVRDARDAGLAAAAALFLAAGGSPVLAVALAAGAGLVLYREVTGAAPVPGPPPAGWRALGPAAAAAGVLAAFGAALFRLRPDLFALFAVMARVDLFAFGGGYAAAPLLFHEVVEARRWLDAGAFLDGMALGQVTPGPIVVTATFVGHQVAGVAGAAAATVGIFGPSFLAVLVGAPTFDRFRGSAPFRRGVRGVLVTFVGLLAAVAFRFGLVVPWRPAAVLIGVGAFAALRRGVNVLWVVAAAGASAVLLP